MSAAAQTSPLTRTISPMRPAPENIDSGQEVNNLPNPADLYPWLPIELTLDLPGARFTVADLLNLKKGAVIETTFHHTRDIPLRANRQPLAWTEVEVVGERLAVRITEFA